MNKKKTQKHFLCSVVQRKNPIWKCLDLSGKMQRSKEVKQVLFGSGYQWEGREGEGG
jgi:hypothetical protein